MGFLYFISFSYEVHQYSTTIKSVHMQISIRLLDEVRIGLNQEVIEEQIMAEERLITARYGAIQIDWVINHLASY